MMERSQFTRAISTPSGMPISTDKPAAMIISASVCMPASHRPNTPITHNSAPIARLRPMRRLTPQAMATVTATTAHQGELRSSCSNHTKACRTG
ncbi:hypothetical protein G6F22_021901 [Rhizopus arrhizus]|nr:hypothetical protein G6F22_021901 [Rhizopus arrhizus]